MHISYMHLNLQFWYDRNTELQRVREMWLEVKGQSQTPPPSEPWAAPTQSHAGAWSA